MSSIITLFYHSLRRNGTSISSVNHHQSLQLMQLGTELTQRMQFICDSVEVHTSANLLELLNLECSTLAGSNGNGNQRQCNPHHPSAPGSRKNSEIATIFMFVLEETLYLRKMLGSLGYWMDVE